MWEVAWKLNLLFPVGSANKKFITNLNIKNWFIRVDLKTYGLMFEVTFSWRIKMFWVCHIIRTRPIDNGAPVAGVTVKSGLKCQHAERRFQFQELQL